MEPTLIMPNGNPDMINTNTPTPSKIPAHHRISRAQMLWLALAVIVIVFLAVYFATKKDSGTGLTVEEKMNVLESLEKESTPIVVDQSQKASIIDKLQKQSESRQ